MIGISGASGIASVSYYLDSNQANANAYISASTIATNDTVTFSTCWVNG
jgi:hypothetical protein